MQLLGHLGIYFDAVVVEVKTFFTFIQIGSGHTVGKCEPYLAFSHYITDKFWLMDFCFETGYHLESKNKEINFDHLDCKMDLEESRNFNSMYLYI